MTLVEDIERRLRRLRDRSGDASGCLAAFFLRRGGRRFLVYERLLTTTSRAAGGELALLRLLDARLERRHEVDDRRLGLRLRSGVDIALLDLRLDELERVILVLIGVLGRRASRRPSV